MPISSKFVGCPGVLDSVQDGKSAAIVTYSNEGNAPQCCDCWPLCLVCRAAATGATSEAVPVGVVCWKIDIKNFVLQVGVAV